MLFDQFKNMLGDLGDDEDPIRCKIETINRRLRTTIQLSEIDIESSIHLTSIRAFQCVIFRRDKQLLHLKLLMLSSLTRSN
jgi:hypothetical protein